MTRIEPNRPAGSRLSATGNPGSRWQQPFRSHRFAFIVALLSIPWTVAVASVSVKGGWGLGQSDGWVTVDGARWIVHGAAWDFYRAAPTYFALPGWPALLAPFVAAGDALRLPEWTANPTLWLAVGPVFAAAGAVGCIGVDVLAAELGVTGRWRQVVVALVGLGAAPTATLMGHPEDSVALGLACVALSRLHRDRPVTAAAWLTAAVMFQTWAALLIPYLVLASPAGQRVRAAVTAAVIPAAAGIGFLASDWKYAYLSLVKQPTALAAAHLGGITPWFDVAPHVTALTSQGFKLAAVSGSPSRTLALVGCLAVAWRFRGDRSAGAILAAGAVIGILRADVEVEVWAYYFLPAITFGLLAAHRSSTAVKLAVADTAGIMVLMFGVGNSLHLGMVPTAAVMAAVSAAVGVAARDRRRCSTDAVTHTEAAGRPGLTVGLAGIAAVAVAVGLAARPSSSRAAAENAAAAVYMNGAVHAVRRTAGPAGVTAGMTVRSVEQSDQLVAWEFRYSPGAQVISAAFPPAADVGARWFELAEYEQQAHRCLTVTGTAGRQARSVRRTVAESPTLCIASRPSTTRP